MIHKACGNPTTMPFNQSAVYAKRPKKTEKSPKVILECVPQDLRQYVLKKENDADFPVCEQEPAGVVGEVISAGPFEIKAYFPSPSTNETVVFIHLPGG